MKITQNENKPIAEEVIADAIIKISSGMQKINESRLNRSAIVALIHDRSKIGKSTIELVLNNLEQMEKLWLKPLKEKR